MKRFLFKVTHESTAANELGLTVLRIFAGLSMALAHGLGKLPPSEPFIAGVGDLGLPLPNFMAWLAALTEFFGGILLCVGFLTRPAAFFLICTMVVAAFGKHINDPFKAKELAITYLVIYLVFVIRGAGKFSVDSLVHGKKTS